MGILFEGGVSEIAKAEPLDIGLTYGESPFHQADATDLTEPVPERIARIAARNGCEPEPTVEPLGASDRYVWACPEGADVELIAHPGGHQWHSTTDGRTTEQLIWEFLEAHPMPE